MKKILGLALGLMIGALSYSQNAPAKFAENMSQYDKAATTVFHFNLDQSITEAAIDDAASYYTDYFTVVSTASNNGHDVAITLVQDDEMSRKVIHRFLVTLQIQNVNVGGSDVPVTDFMDTYINL